MKRYGLERTTRSITRSAVTLGMGSAIAGASGQGATVGPIFTGASSMMGIAATGMMGGVALRSLDAYGHRAKRRRR